MDDIIYWFLSFQVVEAAAHFTVVLSQRVSGKCDPTLQN